MTEGKDTPARTSATPNHPVDEDIKNVCFYDYLEVEAQFFHGPTELIPAEIPIILTTVIKDGTVIDNLASKITRTSTDVARHGAGQRKTELLYR